MQEAPHTSHLLRQDVRLHTAATHAPLHAPLPRRNLPSDYWSPHRRHHDLLLGFLLALRLPPAFSCHSSVN
jgi:hypothetical protein